MEPLYRDTIIEALPGVKLEDITPNYYAIESVNNLAEFVVFQVKVCGLTIHSSHIAIPSNDKRTLGIEMAKRAFLALLHSPSAIKEIFYDPAMVFE